MILVTSRNPSTDPMRQLANVSIDLEEVMEQCMMNHTSDSEHSSAIGTGAGSVINSGHSGHSGSCQRSGAGSGAGSSHSVPTVRPNPPELDFDRDRDEKDIHDATERDEDQPGTYGTSYHTRYEEHPIDQVMENETENEKNQIEGVYDANTMHSSAPPSTNTTTNNANSNTNANAPYGNSNQFVPTPTNVEHVELLHKLRLYHDININGNVNVIGNQVGTGTNGNFNMNANPHRGNGNPTGTGTGLQGPQGQVPTGTQGQGLIHRVNTGSVVSSHGNSTSVHSSCTSGVSGIPSTMSNMGGNGGSNSNIGFATAPQTGLGMSRLCLPGTEEAAMFRDLEVSLNTCNVRLAVSTLRKIYTRQSRQFKIPEILNELMLARKVSSFRKDSSDKMTILFVLSCIQWCFGIQKGEHVDSFKYKMNKNIGCWLLKSISHLHHFGSPVSPEIVHSSQAVVCHILESVAELDFCLEILHTFAVENYHEILKNFVLFWINSDNPVLSSKSLEFAVMNGFPTTQKSMHNQNGQNDYSTDTTRSSISSFVIGNGNGNGSEISSNMAYNVGNMNTGIQQNGNMCVAGGVKTLEKLSAEQLIALPLSKLTPDQKLFVLVTRAPEGLLGARIPSLYRETFGERLRLQGRKLKDVVLSKLIIK